MATFETHFSTPNTDQWKRSHLVMIRSILNDPSKWNEAEIERIQKSRLNHTSIILDYVCLHVHECAHEHRCV